MEDLAERTIGNIYNLKKLRFRIEVKRNVNLINTWPPKTRIEEFIQCPKFDTPCNAVCLYNEVGGTKNIHYVGLTSLYPFTNKRGGYAVANSKKY